MFIESKQGRSGAAHRLHVGLLWGLLFSPSLAGSCAAGLGFEGLCFTSITLAKAAGRTQRYFRPGCQRDQGYGLRTGMVRTGDIVRRKGSRR